MAFGQMGWGHPMYPGYAQAMPDQMAQMRMRQQGGPWQQNRPQYVVMVDGEQAARAYFVPPGEKVVMFDKSRPTFYIKEVDVYNATSFEAFQYDKIQQDEGNESGYVTHAELEEILARFASAQQRDAPKEPEQTEQNASAPRMRRAVREDMSDEQPGV